MFAGFLPGVVFMLGVEPDNLSATKNIFNYSNKDCRITMQRRIQNPVEHLRWSFL